LVGPNLIQEVVEKVKIFQNHLVINLSRYKSYLDQRCHALEFSVGEHMFLHLSPMKGILRFGRKGKLSSKFVGPFEILERVEQVAYRLTLPPELSGVHPVFYVSMLQRYVHDPSHIIQHQTMQLDENLNYIEQSMAIVDKHVKRLCFKDVVSVKVAWRGAVDEKMIWEPKTIMHEKYPHLSETQG